MAQGKFQKKKKKGNLMPIFCITAVIVAICLVGTAIVLSSREDPQADPNISTNTGKAENTGNTAASTLPTQTTGAATEATAAPTQDTTAPTADTTAPTEDTTAATEETTAPTVEATVPGYTTGNPVADLALAQVGKPYLHGGTGPDGFDTSGLVYYCFAQNGLTVPRVISGQSEYGVAVEKEDLQPGDVVFFWTENPGKAEYVGIYVGGGKFVAARNSTKPVSEMDLTGSYFSQRYVCARRYIPE